MNRGIIYAILAYVIWGIMPIYWKILESVPSFQILCHRMIWSLFFLTGLLALRRQWSWLKRLKEKPLNALLFLLTASLLAVNWGVYIWAVNHGHIIDSSLGYFINPLVNVLLGVWILKEKMRKVQWIATLVAAAGVLYLTLQFGRLPWIALALAFSFASYGLFRKIAHLGSLEGLSLEAVLLFIPALSVLLFFEIRGAGSFIRGSMIQKLLLMITGPLTALPLLLFASAARRILFSTVGLLQFIAPTLQFLIGVFLYREPFPEYRLIGFIIVWIALVIYAVEGWTHRTLLRAAND